MNALRLRTLLTLLIAVPVISLSVFAQPAQPSFGPAVQAYLLGLDEEKRELDFQLRQREDLTRRIHTRNRKVARLAAQRRTDSERQK